MSCKSAELNMIEPEDIINDISLALQNGTKNLQKWPNIHFEMLTSLCCVLNPVSLDLSCLVDVSEKKYQNRPFCDFFS